MYYVYVIQSSETYGLYVGFTKDLKKRLVEHNTNKSFSTRKKGPWKLVYYESYRNEEDAITREKNLKYHGQALARLKKRILKSLLLAN